MIKQYNGCAWEVKEKIMDTHSECDYGRKSSFVKGGLLNAYLGKKCFAAESEFRVCQYISRKLKGIKIPWKRVCQMKMLKSIHIEGGDRETRRLVRGRKKFPIRLS